MYHPARNHLYSSGDKLELSLFNEPADSRPKPGYVYFSINAPSSKHVDPSPIIVSAISLNFAAAYNEATSRVSPTSIEYCVSLTTSDTMIDNVTTSLATRLTAAGFTFITPPLHNECQVPLLPALNDFQPPPSRESFLGPYSEYAEVYNTYGFVPIPSILPPVIINPVTTAVLDHIAAVFRSVDAVRKIEPMNRIKFKEVMQRDTGRFDIDLSEVAALRDFVSYVTPKTGTAPWLSTVDIVTRGAVLKRIGVVVSTGGGGTGTQQWHADGPSCNEAGTAVCAFLPLCDLDERTGYTTFWGGTQEMKQEELLKGEIAERLGKASFYKGVGKKGDALLYDYKVVHRGEKNAMAEGEIRPILYLVYGTEDFEETNFSEASVDYWLADRGGGAPIDVNKNKFEIRESDKTGRCLFATEEIKYGELICRAPALHVSKEEYEAHGQHTVMREYVFNLKSGDKLLALGWGGLFNHSSRPNVDYRLDGKTNVVSYFAGKGIAKGDELYIYYGDKLWFVDEAAKGEEGVEEEEEEVVVDDGLGGLGRMEL